MNANWGELVQPASVMIAFVCGSLVGFSEILSRYRDEPLKATCNKFGLTYLAINGLISIGAYGLLVRYRTGIFPGLADDSLMRALFAGFGAMAVMRSKLFIFRTDDGKDIPIGPAVVIETVLRVADRKIDRYRSLARENLVFSQLKDIKDFERAADYLSASLLSLQNLSGDEKQQIAAVINEYRAQASWPPALKTIAAGFAFLNLTGEENFDRLVADLKQYLKMVNDSPSAQIPPEQSPHSS